MAHPIFALWVHPRSVSTAFERLMRARGDLDCAHEPFLEDYYTVRAIRSLPHHQPRGDGPLAYDDVRADLLARAGRGPVFFKDMAYYALDRLLGDALFLAATRHAFLVREPAPALASFARLDPDFTREEAGYDAQWALYQALRERGAAAHVIRSEALREAPESTARAYWRAVGLPDAPQAFSWDGETPDDWRRVEGWHADVLASGAIRPPAAERITRGDLPPRVAAIHDAVTPAYRALAARAG